MSIPVNINDLINSRTVESNRIEFKSDFNPNAVIHTICAFANDIDNIGGGYIVLGVEEHNGSPVFPIKGIEQDRIDGILQELVGYCHMIEPFYEPIAEPVLFDGVYIIVIWVCGGYGRPYKAPVDVYGKEIRKSVKYYYIRKFSSTVTASSDEEKELFYISSDIPFDDRPNLAAEPDDLDIGIIRAYLREVGSDLYEHSLKMSLIDIAKDMQLVSGPPERLKPLNAAILMFSEQPEKYFRYARIEVVDIPDPTGTNMTEKTFSGPIHRQLRDALAYIKNYTVKFVTIKEIDKAEAKRIANFPYAAIEEVLANAVYHKSYQVNEPITVRITPEAIEITSFPGFDRSISEESIKKYNIRARFYRNRRIGDFLKELKLIEGRNTGFPNAIKALTENGSDLMKFDMNEQRDYLSVTIPVHKYFLKKSNSKNAEQYENRILNILKDDSLTLTELAHKMGYKSITSKLKNTVNNLVTNGILKKTAVGNSIKIQYNL